MQFYRFSRYLITKEIFIRFFIYLFFYHFTSVKDILIILKISMAFWRFWRYVDNLNFEIFISFWNLLLSWDNGKWFQFEKVFLAAQSSKNKETFFRKCFARKRNGWICFSMFFYQLFSKVLLIQIDLVCR